MSDLREPDEGTGSAAPGPSGTDRAGHLGYVAHEIRNPLSTALWTAELLARLSPEERGGARGEKLAGICLRSVGRVRLLVEDHLLGERLDAGGYPFRLEPVLLSEVLEAIQARRPAAEPALTVPADRALAARADRGLLERALDGVIAVAAAGGGPVVIAAEALGGRLEIRVGARAVGSLEDPSKGAASDQSGRSLALSTARRVARALGGTLQAAPDGYLLAIPAA